MKIRRLRWYIATLLLLATVINYVDRQALSVLAPVLRDRFGMSNTDYSRILFGFLLAYSFMQTGSGRIMDWLGTRRGFTLTITVWSLAAMLHAAASSVLSFGVFRFMLGLGEAGNWPGAVKAIAEWFPPRERAFAIGMFNSGSCLGAVLAPPAATWILLHWGWRETFLVTGSLGFLWLIPWLILFRPPREHRWITAEEREHIGTLGPRSMPGAGIPWKGLFRFRQVWGLMLARSFADPVWWFYVFWLPEYFKRERHFSMAAIGLFVWIPFLTADLGNFIGGGLSGWLVRRGWAPLSARKTVMCVSALVMLAGIPAVLVQDASAALALISLATMAYSAWAANVLTLPADIFPQRVVASVSGLSGTGGAIGGMAFTLITGIVVDRVSYLPIFMAAGLMPPLAAAFLLWQVRATVAEETLAPAVSSRLCD